jgi:hypothetical protein
VAIEDEAVRDVEVSDACRSQGNGSFKDSDLVERPRDETVEYCPEQRHFETLKPRKWCYVMTPQGKKCIISDNGMCEKMWKINRSCCRFGSLEDVQSIEAY